jgi:thiol-disulfide isomerase/thioredoxin
MRRAIVNSMECLFGILLLAIAGCGEAPKPAPSGNPSPQAQKAPELAPPAKSEPSHAPENAVADKEPAQTPDAKSKPDAEEEMDDEGPPEEMAAKEPSDMDQEELLGQMIEKLESGIFKLRRNNAEGYQSFQDAAVFAEELQKRFPDMSPLERRVCSIVFFYQARALAQGDTPQDAAPAIAHALKLGFDDFERLEKEDDLEKLRALPDYEQWLKDWEAQAAEVAAAEIQRELKEFESYPFDFALPDLDEKEVKLADYLGKVVIVDIWGTWCPPCREEIPSFVKLQEKFGEKGLQIVGLNYEMNDDNAESVKQIREFMDNQPINYPCLLGDDKTREQVPEFQGFPTTLFIDRTGKVRLQYVGLHSYGRLEATIVALLDEKADEKANEKETDKPADADSSK